MSVPGSNVTKQTQAVTSGEESTSEGGFLPLYRKVQNDIREEILKGHIELGQRLPQEEDLCKKHGVSTTTMKRALTELVNEGLVKRIRGAGTFVAESTVSKSYTIAAFIPARPETPYDHEIVWNIENAAHQAGHDVLICNTEEDLSKIDSYLEKFSRNEKKIDGVIYIPVAISKGYYEENITRIRRLQAAGVEVVLCDRCFLNIPDAIVGFGLDCVYSDDVKGSAELVKHLFDCSRETIAIISSPMDYSNVENRIVGYRKVLAAHGHAYRSELIKFVECYYTRQEVARVVDELLELPERPDAIFAINDRMAETVMACLKDKGISVPQEMAVVGYDNIELSQYLDVPLTTVDRDSAEMGQVAMELLLERIAGKRTTPRHIALPTKLVVRESCGGKPVGRKAGHMAVT